MRAQGGCQPGCQGMIGTEGFKPNVQGANQVELSMLVFLELRGDLGEQLARARAANGAIRSDVC